MDALAKLSERIDAHERRDDERHTDLIRRQDAAQTGSEARHAALVELLRGQIAAQQANNSELLGVITGRETRAGSQRDRIIGILAVPVTGFLTALGAWYFSQNSGGNVQINSNNDAPAEVAPADGSDAAP